MSQASTVPFYVRTGFAGERTVLCDDLIEDQTEVTDRMTDQVPFITREEKKARLLAEKGHVPRAIKRVCPKCTRIKRKQLHSAQLQCISKATLTVSRRHGRRQKQVQFGRALTNWTLKTEASSKFIYLVQYSALVSGETPMNR